MGADLLTLVVLAFIAAAFTSAASDSELRYVGCFDPAFAINKNYHKHLSPFTRGDCVSLCRNIIKARYMGAEASDDFCYCGDDIPDGSVRRNDSLCNSPCPETPPTNETCGGDWLISVYDLGSNQSSHGDDSVGPVRNVSFLVGTSQGVRMYSSATVGSFATISNTSTWAYSVDYHLKRNSVYIFTNGDLYRSTLEPKLDPAAARPDRLGKLSGCEGFAVDWVHDTIYWMDCSTNYLKLMDLEGNNVTTLKKTCGDRKSVKRMEVDPLVGKLFWVADGTLEYSDLTGENFHTNVSLAGVYVRAFTLDLAGRRVFYIGTTNVSTNLYETAYSSATPVDTTKHPASQQMRSIYGLGVLGGLLYWVNYANVRDVIYSQPLNFTGQPHAIQPIERAVWHMKVVDAELQPEWAENPCGRAGCSHHCVHQRGLARCLCPDGMRLTGNSTCTNIPRSYQYVGCYSAEYSGSGWFTHRVDNLTLDSCVSLCHNEVHYAGIDISQGHCHCVVDLVDVASPREDGLCNLPCPGSPGLTCGGDWLISAYELGDSHHTGTDGHDGLKFLIGVSSGVVLHDPARPKAGLTSLMNLTSWGYNVDYHYKKNLVYVATKGLLYRSKLLGKPKVAAPEVMKITSCDGFAVDWEADQIYFADCINNTIASMGLDGSNQRTLLELPEASVMIKRMEVDPYARVLFWSSDGILESCDLSGANFRTNLTDPRSIMRAFALDLSTRTIYYITIGSEEAQHGLFSLQYDSSEATPERLAVLSQMKSVYGVGVFKGSVYWINYANIRDVIYKTSLYFAQPNDVEVIKVVDKAAWHMKLVHPDLQRRPVTSQSDKIKAVSSVGHLSVGAVIMGLFLIIAVVILAGSLVYLADTHWPRLRSRLFPQAQGAAEPHDDTSDTSAYNTTNDRVLLI